MNAKAQRRNMLIIFNLSKALETGHVLSLQPKHLEYFFVTFNAVRP